MAADKTMNVQGVIALLNDALPPQMRSAAAFTWAAGSATGIEVAVAEKLEGFGRLELDDARRLIEKIVALGGDATTATAHFEPFDLSPDGIGRLIAMETDAAEALRKVIPETGEQARSEALEHLLEHIIRRKQEQIDFLERVRRGTHE